MNSIFITVRTGSSRLPKKALREIGNCTTIEFLIDRLKLSSYADNIVLCTTTLDEDDILIEIAKKKGIKSFRGSQNDKLERWHGAAKKFGTEFFVTADGDDTFCEPVLIDSAFKQYERNESSFIEAEGIICGAFTNGISTKALEKVCSIKGSEETEMIWPYFKETNLFNVEQLEGVENTYFRDDLRLTLDYKEDLEFMKSLYDRRNPSNSYLSILEIVTIIEECPELLKINFFRHKEWAENQAKTTNLVLN